MGGNTYHQASLPLLPRSHLPPTPDSPSLPTILPLVEEPIGQLSTLDSLAVDYKTAAYSSHPSISHTAPSSLLAGLSVMSATRNAIDHMHHIYATNSSVQESFTSSISLIASTIRKHGRLIVCGVGKSGKIAHKFVATCNSMRIRAGILDPTDALHGDLGSIGENDTIALLTASSNTPELRLLLPHLTPYPLILLSARPHTLASPNPLIQHRLNLLTAAQTLSKRPSSVSPTILLLTPLAPGMSDKGATGLSAPTVSTTVTLAVCDAVAVGVAHALFGGGEQEDSDLETRSTSISMGHVSANLQRNLSMESVEAVFRECHPGGNLGVAGISAAGK